LDGSVWSYVSSKSNVNVLAGKNCGDLNESSAVCGFNSTIFLSEYLNNQCLTAMYRVRDIVPQKYQQNDTFLPA
jgi:hypothetical protein